MVCTDEDMRIYHGENMRLLKTYEDAFLEQPPVKKPGGVWGSNGGFLFLNDNAIHLIYSITYSVGKFGYAYPNEGYHYAQQIAVASSSYLVFDENAGTFLGYTAGRNTPLVDAYPAYLGHNYTDQQLLWLGSRHMYDISSLKAYAITRDKNDNTLRVISTWPNYIQNNLFVFESELVLPPESGLGTATAYTCHGGGSVSTIVAGHEVLYYSAGDNRVHYYNLVNQVERLDAVTIPPDESIAYIQHVYDYYWQENHFVILANKGNGWKLYVHDMVGATHDINPTPSATYSGEGTAVNLIYRHPNIKLTY
jgi:hypothetical protein